MHAYSSPTVTNQNDEDAGRGMRKSTIPGATYVHNKENHNDIDTTVSGNPVVKPGAYVYDDKWINNANLGSNAKIIGWNQTTGLSGKGVKAFGRAIAESRQFPICMASRVFASVCKRDPATADQAFIKKIANDFSTSGQYKLKYLFEHIAGADECIGVQK